MPGVTRSAACQKCKVRKIKCDQNWPTCTQCLRKKFTCPGPTSLIKFVQTHEDRGQREAPAEQPPGSGVLELRESRRYGQQKSNRDSPGAEAEGSQALAHYRSFRFRTSAPRPNLTTVSDRVASRLVHHLDGERNWGWVFSMQYLELLPQRLTENPGLRDIVGLFCSVLGDYRRTGEATDFFTLPAYGKALRSLRRAFTSGKPLTVDTLASLMMLERTENVFNRGRDHLCTTHSAAIASVMQKLGPPKPDNKLHLGLVSDSYGTLALYFFNTGRSNFLNEEPWGELIADNMVSWIENEEARPPFNRLLLASHVGFGALPNFVRRCQTLYFGSQDKDATQKAEMATQLMHDIAETEKPLGLKYLELNEKCFELGLISEKDDPSSIAGSTYDFQYVYLAQSMVSALGLRLILLRMLFDCSNIYAPDETEPRFAQLRESSVEVWKFSHFLQSLEACVAPSTVAHIFPTLEVAKDEEKEALLDMISEMERFRQRLPRDRVALEHTVTYLTMMLTGRAPPSF